MKIIINCTQLEYKGNFLFILCEALKKISVCQYKDTQMKPQTEVSQQSEDVESELCWFIDERTEMSLFGASMCFEWDKVWNNERQHICWPACITSRVHSNQTSWNLLCCKHTAPLYAIILKVKVCLPLQAGRCHSDEQLRCPMTVRDRWRGRRP